MVSRFGHVVRVVETPGLHLKLPFERVLRVDRRLLYSRPGEAEYLTADKKNVVVRSLALVAGRRPQAVPRDGRGHAPAPRASSADVVLAEIGAALGNYPFASFVSAAGGREPLRDLVAEVRSAVQAYALPAFGIEVVDVDLRQLYLPEANRRSVFERMKAERGRIATQFRSEGERDATRMIAEADREKTRIAAEAEREAARDQGRGRGAGDATSTPTPSSQRRDVLQVPAQPAGVREVPRRQDHAVPAGRRRDLRDPARRARDRAGHRAIAPEAPVADDAPDEHLDGRPRAEAEPGAGTRATEAVP